MIVFNFFRKNGLLFEFDKFLMKLTDRIEIFILFYLSQKVKFFDYIVLILNNSKIIFIYYVQIYDCYNFILLLLI